MLKSEGKMVRMKIKQCPKMKGKILYRIIKTKENIHFRERTVYILRNIRFNNYQIQ